jgi:hypothetical protein
MWCNAPFPPASMEYTMNIRNLAIAFLALIMVSTSAPTVVIAQEEKTTWDDLQLAKSSRSQRLYLLPGASFQPYSKILLDTTEVAFRKNWMRNFNQSRSLSMKVGQDDIDRVIQEVSSSFGSILAEQYRKGGYQVVQVPGPGVLRIRTGVIDLAVNSPDVRSANRTYSASWEAGEATLVVEARDSQSGALLGRALDRRLAGDRQPYMRNRVTNKADFNRMFLEWAKLSVDGLTRLKGSSPVVEARK